MDTAAATVTISDRGYQVVPAGLVVTRSLSFAEWRALGKSLAEVQNRTTWAIGDWLVYGEGRGDYGSYYREAAVITGRSFENLSQAARISKAFPLDVRTVFVSWSFYRESLRLPEADRFRTLQIAERNKWTRDDLADFIASRGVDSAVPTDGGQVTTTRRRLNPVLKWTQRSRKHRPYVQCPLCGFKWEPKRRT